MTAPAACGIAVVTVMRGEVDLYRRLAAELQWADERHLVETAPEPPSWASGLPSVRAHHAPLPEGAAFDQARQVALPHVRAPWVLVVDTDETVPAALVELLRRRTPEWTEAGVTGVWVPRCNVVLGRRLRHGSLWPDEQLRYLRRDTAAFGAALHGVASTAGETVRLPADERIALQHLPFRSTEQYVSKVNRYTSIEAEQAGPRTRGGLAPALRAGARDFLGRYVHMRGYRDGWTGLHYSLVMAGYRYLVEAKRWEAGSVEAAASLSATAPASPAPPPR